MTRIMDEILETILPSREALLGPEVFGTPNPQYNPANPSVAETIFWDRMNRALTNVYGKDQQERLSEQFPVRAHRALKYFPYDEGRAKNNPQFFSGRPETSNTYLPASDLINSDKGTGTWSPNTLEAMRMHVLPANLELGRVLEIDGDGSYWSRIPLTAIPEEARTAVKGRMYGVDSTVSTDTVVQAAQKLGYDSVHFKNIVDPGGNSTESSDPEWKDQAGDDDIYVMINPAGTRARGALADPRKKGQNNLMAEIALATGGAGVAAGVSQSEDIRDTLGL